MLRNNPFRRIQGSESFDCPGLHTVQPPRKRFLPVVLCAVQRAQFTDFMRHRPMSTEADDNAESTEKHDDHSATHHHEKMEWMNDTVSMAVLLVLYTLQGNWICASPHIE